MARRSRFSQEVRERAVRMVFEHGNEYGSEWEAMCSIAEKIGCSKTIRTARSRTSWENLLLRAMTPSSQRMEPPENPGRFS